MPEFTLAYTALDLQTTVQDDLQDSNFSTTRILRYLNYGQQAIFATHMFKFCERSISGPLTVGVYTYDQQTDHQSTIGGSLIDPNNTSRRFELDDTTYLAHREFFDCYPDPSLYTNGIPLHWTEFGQQVYFNRPADVLYTFKQRYYRAPTDMSSPTDVPDVPQPFREVLEFYALYRSEKYRGNHDVAGSYKQQYDDGLENMVLRYSEATQVGPVVMPSNRRRVSESL